MGVQQAPTTNPIGVCRPERRREEKDERKAGLTREQKERIGRNKEAAIKKKRGVEIKMHPIHQQWCKDEKEHKYTGGVQGILKH